LAGSSLREGSPRGRAAAGTGVAADAIPAIVVLLALGLFLRVIIAYVLLPGSGFPNDLSAFQYWANDIAHNGPIGFYARQGFVDYPPVYLGLLGILSFLMGGDIGEGVKLVPMFADLGLAALVFLIAVELGASWRRALVVAFVIVVNPITWINSAIWGQADAAGSIFLLLGVRELLKDRRETAAALAVVAVLTKIQLGILGILVGFVILRRSLAPKEGPADPIRILTSVGAGLLTAGAILLPFTGLDFLGVADRLTTVPGSLTLLAGVLAALGVVALVWVYAPVEATAYRAVAAVAAGAATVLTSAAMTVEPIANHVISAFGEYPYLSLNAYNPWALLGTANGQAMVRNLSWIRDSAWEDPQSGTSGPGYVIGYFTDQWVFAIASVALLLFVGAFVARRLAASRDEEGAPAQPDETAASEGGFSLALWAARHDWATELRGLSAALAVSAVVLLALLLAQPFGLPAALVGDALLVAVLVTAAAWAAWRDDGLSLLVGLTIMAVAFFALPTRVHERYLFPFFAVGAVLFTMSWRWRIAYVLLAVVNTANLLSVLTQYCGIPSDVPYSCVGGPAQPLRGSQQIASWFIDAGKFISSAEWSGLIWMIAVSAIVTGIAMVWALLQMRGMAVRSLASEAAGAAEDWPWFSGTESGTADESEELPVRRSLPAAPGAALESGMEALSTTPREDADWEYDEEYDELEEGERPVYVPRGVMRVWRRIAGPSSYPDRSASLTGESGGRVDKLDIWVVAALVVAILCLRVYRLGEPTQMYFDEVYHARTATEFLQDWNYGTPYNIPGGYVYEWTHPMLAKYAIAGGITLFSDDKVTSSGQISTNAGTVTIKDAYLQPRLVTSPLAQVGVDNAFSNTDNRFGDRVFLATGSSVLVFDLQTRELVHTYDIAGASAFSAPDDNSGVLYVGTEQGRIWRIDVNSLDKARLGVDQIAEASQLSVETGLNITHLYAGTPPFILAADASGNIVSVDLTDSGGTVVARGNVPGAADFADLGTAPKTVDATPAKVTDPAAEAQLLASLVGGDAAAIENAIRSASPNFEIALPVPSLTSDQITAVNDAISAGSLPGISVQETNPEVLVAYQDGLGLLDVRHAFLTTHDPNGHPIAALPTSAPATSIAINPASANPNNCQPGYGCSYSYVATGDSIELFLWDITGDTPSVSSPGSQPLTPMPGQITKVIWDSATKVLQAVGKAPGGSGWAVYAIESNANAVFDDATIPFDPVAVGLDSTPQMPDTNREALMTFSADGSMASVDVGQFAFSWRILGVLFGALMAACLYLLIRILFRRRSVALLVAFFSLFDGMLFAQSRIAMNDTYVGGFLLLGYLLFALIWMGVWKRRAAFWIVMPILGLVLGLALASKWVAFYAMASIGILILIRSALGRVITILGLAAGTGVLGYQAIAEMTTVPDTGNSAMVISLVGLAVIVVIAGTFWTLRQRTAPDRAFTGISTAVVAALLFGAGLTFFPNAEQNGAPNYTFFIIMLVVTTLAAAGNAYRPVAWTREELQFATIGPAVVGVVAIVFGFALEHGFLGGVLSSFITAQGATVLKLGAALIGLGVFDAVAFYLASFLGFGPLARTAGESDLARFAGPPSPAPEGWLRLGSGFGLPAAWTAFCVMILPIIVYVVMYIPWAMPWHEQTATTGPMPAIACWHVAANPDGSTTCTDAWPAGHTGQTLWDLTLAMYNYHNNLRQPHAASSPWWAWPMDLKPVWFESISYANNNGSMIYDGGNPVLWWLAIGAMAFLCWQAFKRRSLGLALIAVAFLWQWLSWSRIDRASFQYHFYTALPFFLAGLAYFLAELWHGPSRRTWLLARAMAIGACLFPGVMWVLKPELCGLARVDTSDYFGNTVCGSGTGDVVIETRLAMIGVVLVLAFIALGALLWRLERRQEQGYEDRYWAVQLALPVAVFAALLWWIGQAGPRTTLIQAALPSDSLAPVFVVVGILLAVAAAMVTSPRRYVLGVCGFAVVVFVALYPNLSALPMPQAITGIYNSILPTWLYGFQFSVNQQFSSTIQLFGLNSALIALLALVVAMIAGWVAWERRLVIGYREARALHTAEEAGEAGEAGETGEAVEGGEAGATTRKAASAQADPPADPVDDADGDGD
jgi:hypothetical protein